MLILHGENINRSRRFLTEQKKNFGGEVINLEGDKINLNDLKQAIESKSIFGEEKLIVVSGLFSRRPSKEKEELLKYCRQESPKNLIIWEGKKIDGRLLRHFPLARIEQFELTPIIFRFLDSFSPKNKKHSLILLHQCLTQDSPELVFFMLCRHVRDLIIAVDLGKRGLEQLPSWKQSKLISQAKMFGLEKLITLYGQLLEIDYQQKTGRSALSLASQLDLLVANL